MTNKYRNRKTEVDGLLFDSQAEARRYQELKLLEHAGKITGLKLQYKFPIIVNDVKVCAYIADFCYRDEERGDIVVEDVKGVKTPVYNLKKKLMKAYYGVEIKETK